MQPTGNAHRGRHHAAGVIDLCLDVFRAALAAGIIHLEDGPAFQSDIQSAALGAGDADHFLVSGMFHLLILILIVSVLCDAILLSGTADHADITDFIIVLRNAVSNLQE